MHKERVVCKQAKGDADEPITTTMLASSVSIHVIVADTDVVVMLKSQASKLRTSYVGKTCILVSPDCWAKKIYTLWDYIFSSDMTYCVWLW